MYQTQLMKVASKYGDSGISSKGSRVIDPLVVRWCESAESTFGPSFIDSVELAIGWTKTGISRQKQLSFLGTKFFKDCLPLALRSNPEIARECQALPSLNDSSYVDYFLMVQKAQSRVSGSEALPLGFLMKLLSGYQTETPGDVIDSLVQFYQAVKDPKGLAKLLIEFCMFLKEPLGDTEAEKQGKEDTFG